MNGPRQKSLFTKPRPKWPASENRPYGSAANWRAAGNFGDIPVIVLTPGIRTPKWYTGDVRTQADAARPACPAIDARTAHIVVQGHQSLTPYEVPEEVVEAVREVVTASRRTGPGTSSSARLASADR